jgi:hypothetical protein
MICSTKKTAAQVMAEQRPLYEPTPEQIRAACAEIQKGWTEAERRRRSNQRSTRWVQESTMQRRIAVEVFDDRAMLDVA